MQSHHTTQPQDVTKHTIVEDLTISAARAQLLSLLYFLPLALVLSLPFIIRWPARFNKAAYQAALPAGTSSATLGYMILLTVVLGIVVHELIHGITWSMFAKSRFRSIKFGILWKSFTPYCHCSEPLKVNVYLIGVLMPALVLGILPIVVSHFTGNILLFSFGMFFTLAAGGDFLIVNLLRKTNPEYLVQDHPSKIGCLLYKPLNSAS